jgi:hypothetical protein
VAVPLFDDDQVFDADQRHHFAAGIDKVVMGVQNDGFQGDRVALGIAFQQFIDGIPASYVVPAEIARRDSSHIGGLFQYRIVDGDVVAEGKGLRETRGEGARSEWGQGGQDGGGARQMLAQLIEQHIRAPEKHAGIPKEIAGFEITFRLGQFGLFVKASNLQGFHASGDAIAGEFDVAVAGFGPPSGAGRRRL